MAGVALGQGLGCRVLVVRGGRAWWWGANPPKLPQITSRPPHPPSLGLSLTASPASSAA